MGTEAYSITSTFIVHNEPLTAGIMLSVNTPGRHGSKKFKKHTLETMYLYNCGEVKYRFTPEDRFIDAGSKWIVVFIGGDITKPQIIGRYYE